MPTEHDHPAPARVHLRSFSEDVLVERPDAGTGLRVVTRWGEFVFPNVPSAVAAALERMSMGPTSVENIVPARPDERAQLASMLGQLSGSVVHTLNVDDGGGTLLSVLPVTDDAHFQIVDIDARRPLLLSRFAALHTGQDGLLMESAISPFHVVLHRSLAYWVAVALGRTTSVARIAESLRIPRPVVADLVAYLVAAGVVLPGAWNVTVPKEREQGAGRAIVGGRPRPAESVSGATFPEDTDPDLARWSHHDLMFHAHSRMGRALADLEVPTADLPPPPVTKPLPPGPRFPLYRPETGDLLAAGQPLAEVIANDRSGTDVSDRPVSAELIGELLFRAARVRSVSPTPLGEPAGGVTYETSDRPYLSIAGRYELELYLSLNRCAGLPRGIYHYDPAGHALTLINDSDSDLTRLLDDARIAAGRPEHPSTLITVTARAERLLFNLNGTGYSATLMHLGALQQTLYLVAAASGLASCPLALVTSDATDRALRLRWPGEVGIGECIVGLRHPAE